MVLRTALFPPILRAPLLLVGAVGLATPLLFAHGGRQGALVETAPPVAAAPLAHDEAPTTRSYAYYPEQLAALSSLNAFQPVADPGRPAVATPPAQVQEPTPTPGRKVARLVSSSRPEAPRRAAPVSVAAPASPETPAAAAQAQPPGWSVFGVKLPRPGWPDGAALRRQADVWRDAAGNQAASLSEHITHLWR